MIAQGHRNIWCSTSDDADCGAQQAGLLQRDLEPLWFKYGLDLWINGHEHSCKDRSTPFPPGTRISKSLAQTLSPLSSRANMLFPPPPVRCGAPFGSLARAFPAGRPNPI